jgi:hypothetical protein
MADETTKPDENPEPPKIRIRPPSEGTPPQGTAGEDAPLSKFRVGAGERKQETTRIEVGKAHAPTAGRPGDKKAETTRVDLSAAKPPPAGLGAPPPSDLYKRSTMRIEPAPPAAPGKSETQRVKAETHRIAEDLARTKSITAPIGQVDTTPKRDTTRVEPPTGEAAKKQTSRIDIASASRPPTGVSMKSSTVPMGVPMSPPPPAPGAAGRPKTIQVKRAAAAAAEASIVPPSPAQVEAAAEARKSETARIEMPEDVGERPPTRPKTIRIKRPDGSGSRKPLTIARPEEDEDVAAIEAAGAAVDEDAPAAWVGIAALVATLVSAVLVYALLAQTVATNLPYPGRV